MSGLPVEANTRGDAVESARSYRIAADAGNASAQNNLGALLESGEGRVPKNPREAGRRYRLAAEQDFPGGQANLATRDAFGRGGLARDDREAVRLWRLAAEQGGTEAKNTLRRLGVRP